MAQRDEQKHSNKKVALGKGFSSLLGLDEKELNDTRPGAVAQDTLSNNSNKKQKDIDYGPNEIAVLDISSIEPNPQQPRKLFDDKALKELSESIKVDGVLQPIIVSRGDKKGRYMIVAGERRWRASKLAGLDSIPAIIKDGATEDLLRLALIENIQRQDLNIIEEAEAFDVLIKDYGLTQEQCAAKVGKDRASIANTLRLLGLPREIQDDLVENRLTMGHGRALLSLEDKKLMLRARDIVISKNLNVRQTEQLCKSFSAKEESPGSLEAQAVNPDLEYIAENLRSVLRTKIKIAGNPQKGKIEISYFTSSDLDRIVSQLGIYSK